MTIMGVGSHLFYLFSFVAWGRSREWARVRQRGESERDERESERETDNPHSWNSSVMISLSLPPSPLLRTLPHVVSPCALPCLSSFSPPFILPPHPSCSPLLPHFLPPFTLVHYSLLSFSLPSFLPTPPHLPTVSLFFLFTWSTWTSRFPLPFPSLLPGPASALAHIILSTWILGSEVGRWWRWLSTLWPLLFNTPSHCPLSDVHFFPLLTITFHLYGHKTETCSISVFGREIKAFDRASVFFRMARRGHLPCWIKIGLQFFRFHSLPCWWPWIGSSTEELAFLHSFTVWPSVFYPPWHIVAYVGPDDWKGNFNTVY